MKHNPNAVSVAQLQERLGAQSAAGTTVRHAQVRNSAAGRTTAKVFAGAAIAGGAALVSGPMAQAQSAEVPTPEQIQDMATQVYNDHFAGQIDQATAQQYADVAGIDLGSLSDVIPRRRSRTDCRRSHLRVRSALGHLPQRHRLRRPGRDPDVCR